MPSSGQEREGRREERGEVVGESGEKTEGILSRDKIWVYTYSFTDKMLIQLEIWWVICRELLTY